MYSPESDLPSQHHTGIAPKKMKDGMNEFNFCRVFNLLIIYILVVAHAVPCFALVPPSPAGGSTSQSNTPHLPRLSQISPPPDFISLSETDIYIRNRPSPDDPKSAPMLHPWADVDKYYIPSSPQVMDTLF